MRGVVRRCRYFFEMEFLGFANKLETGSDYVVWFIFARRLTLSWSTSIQVRFSESEVRMYKRDEVNIRQLWSEF